MVEACSFDAPVPVCFKWFCAEVAHYGEGEVEHGAHGYGEVDDELVHQAEWEGQKVCANGQLQERHGD